VKTAPSSKLPTWVVLVFALGALAMLAIVAAGAAVGFYVGKRGAQVTRTPHGR
jgi:hypothetical protein